MLRRWAGMAQRNSAPSLTELTSETNLAVGTVRRAIDVLVREHRVRTVPGRGTFIIGD